MRESDYLWEAQCKVEYFIRCMLDGSHATSGLTIFKMATQNKIYVVVGHHHTIEGVNDNFRTESLNKQTVTVILAKNASITLLHMT